VDDNLFIYSELRESIQEDIICHINEGGFSLNEAMSAVLQDTLGYSDTINKIEEIMVYTCLMIISIKYNEYFDYIKTFFNKIIIDNNLENCKDKVELTEYKLLKKDIFFIKEKLSI